MPTEISPVSASIGDYAIAAVSGLLIALTFPDYGFWPLAWVGLAPLFIVLRGKTLLCATGLGFVTGLVYFGPTLYWISNTMTNFASMPLWIAGGATSLMVSAAALYPAAVAHLFNRIERRFGWETALLMAPFCWITLEFIRGNQFDFSFTWARLADSQYVFLPIIQMADIAGEEGLGFLIVLANTAVAKVFWWAMQPAKDKKRFPGGHVAITAGLIAMALLYGYWRLEAPAKPDVEKIKVALIQGNIDQSKKWRREYRDVQIEIYKTRSIDAARKGAKLIVWPETAAPFYFGVNRTYDEKLLSLARDTKAPIIFGAPGFKKEGKETVSFNRAWVARPDGFTQKYDKIHLVPFGEYVPFKKMLFFINRVVTAIGDMRPGASLDLLDTGGSHVGVQICYEIIFPKYSREIAKLGAGAIANITNDSWYGVSPASNQMMAMAVFRAVENRIPVLRAAQTGVSAVIDSTGKITSRTRLFVEDTLIKEIALKKGGVTIYGETGNLFSWICVVATLFALSYRRVKRRRG